jgi:hypothetical protein
MKNMVTIVTGEVAEWLKAAVLKTVELMRAPGVQIPPSPPIKK